MRRFWFGRFLEAEGSGGGGSAPEPGGGPQGGGQEPKGGTPGGDGGAGGEDVSGLKSALEKERQARKDLSQQISELREIAGRAADGEKKLAEYEAKLADYEFRERREAALDAAIARATEDGRSSVDRGVAARLAAKLGRGDELERDISDIVEALRFEPSRGVPPPRSTTGQPPEPTGDDGSKTLTELYRTDPEAYRRAVAERARKSPFMGGQRG